MTQDSGLRNAEQENPVLLVSRDVSKDLGCSHGSEPTLVEGELQAEGLQKLCCSRDPATRAWFVPTKRPVTQRRQKKNKDVPVPTWKKRSHCTRWSGAAAQRAQRAAPILTANGGETIRSNQNRWMQEWLTGGLEHGFYFSICCE